MTLNQPGEQCSNWGGGTGGRSPLIFIDFSDLFRLISEEL